MILLKISATWLFLNCHLWVKNKTIHWRSNFKTFGYFGPPVACLLKLSRLKFLSFSCFIARKRISHSFRSEIFGIFNLLSKHRSSPWITSCKVTFPITGFVSRLCYHDWFPISIVSLNGRSQSNPNTYFVFHFGFLSNCYSAIKVQHLQSDIS